MAVGAALEALTNRLRVFRWWAQSNRHPLKGPQTSTEVTTPARIGMTEMDDWILMVNPDDHEMQVEAIDRVKVASGAAVSVCPSLRNACGAKMVEHAVQKMIGYEHGEARSVT